MRILVDRFIYQGLRYLPSRHAARDQAIRGQPQDQDEKGSVLALAIEPDGHRVLPDSG